jgi:hypothetical protein
VSEGGLETKLHAASEAPISGYEPPDLRGPPVGRDEGLWP